MAQALEFDFVDDDTGGRFTPVGGPITQLRQLLARGEVQGATRLYEETGAVAREELVLEAGSASLETRKAIGQLFRAARDFAAAARVFQQARLEGEAAVAFEQAGDFASAAASWAKVGEVLKAAAAWERAGRVDQAVQLYRDAGAPERAAECLARARRFVEAAREFRAMKNPHAEVETLRAGLAADPASVELATRLAELMFQHGRREQAAPVLMQTSKLSAAARDDARFLTLLALSLEAVGNAPAAEKVRARLGRLPAAAVQLEPASPNAAPEPGADAYGFLKALPMFADLALDDMKALYRSCQHCAFTAGQHLLEAGQPGRGLFVIVAGEVEVVGGPDGGWRLLNTLGVGGYVGEISLVQDGLTSARVTARTPVRALFISRDAFRHYLYGSPAAALRIFQLFTVNLAERVRVLSAAR